MELEEYIVTLWEMSDLDQFYDDMETAGGNLYIPNRAVNLALRRPISKNTHYMLSAEEAETIKNDPRVRAVISIKQLNNLTITPNSWESGTKTFVRSIFNSNQNSNTYNWALLRCTNINNIKTGNYMWGSEYSNITQTANIGHSLSGKNVDVIIIDGHFDPTHPEFAVNADGTGGSRVNQFDWYSLNSIVIGLDDDAIPMPSGSYSYAQTGITGVWENHGCGNAGVSCGNTNGFARDANIYNIEPGGQIIVGGEVYNFDYLLYDYIRAFHLNKSINVNTGRKNPTVATLSYGSVGYSPYNNTNHPVTEINYRGTIITNGGSPLTNAQLTSAGINFQSEYVSVFSIQVGVDALMSDIEQAVADGIIVVGSAGNDSQYIDVVGGVDYDNYFYTPVNGTPTKTYYMRGSHGSAVGVITVGSISQGVWGGFPESNSEYKSDFSNTGPRVDIYAPGGYIITSALDYDHATNGITDPRNPSYYKQIASGTSKAAPIVAGVIACVLEMYPDMSPAEMKQYLTYHAGTNKLNSVDPFGNEILGNNKYLYAYPERPKNGVAFPKVNYKLRPDSGVVYPRRRIPPK